VDCRTKLSIGNKKECSPHFDQIRMPNCDEKDVQACYCKFKLLYSCRCVRFNKLTFKNSKKKQKKNYYESRLSFCTGNRTFHSIHYPRMAAIIINKVSRVHHLCKTALSRSS